MIEAFIWGVLIGYIFTLYYEFYLHRFERKKGVKPKTIIKGYRFHHSMFGVILLFLFMFFSYIFLLGASLGIILRHTLEERKFVFIDKDI